MQAVVTSTACTEQAQLYVQSLDFKNQYWIFELKMGKIRELFFLNLSDSNFPGSCHVTLCNGLSPGLIHFGDTAVLILIIILHPVGHTKIPQCTETFSLEKRPQHREKAAFSDLTASAWIWGCI